MKTIVEHAQGLVYSLIALTEAGLNSQFSFDH